jgi:ribokinase
MKALRIGVVGHVEHVTLGHVDSVPRQGDVIHLRESHFMPGGGGGIAFAQLCRSNVEVHLFTAVGSDAAGQMVSERLSRVRDGVHVHAAVRQEAHPRVVVMVDHEGKRTIVVTGAPLQAAASDALPWEVLADCDAVYFTGADPDSLVRARQGRLLVATARRAPVLRAARVVPDVIVGSVSDPRENAPFDSYDPAPSALVLTDGPRAIRIERAKAVSHVAPHVVQEIKGDYGAGDSFAGALTFFLAHGCTVEDACRRAAPFGAAVLRGTDPLLVQDDLPPSASVVE